MTDEEKRLSHAESVRKYARLNTKYVGLQLNIDTDQDILEVLDQCGNKQGFVKKAIREYIKKPENIQDPETQPQPAKPITDIADHLSRATISS